jgi:hypothetical protein
MSDSINLSNKTMFQPEFNIFAKNKINSNETLG